MKKLPTTLIFVFFVNILLFGAGKCFGQDTLPPKKYSFPHQRNVLLIKKTQPTSLSPTEKGCFRVYYRIQVVSRDSSFNKGKIKYISDSSIFLNRKEIKLKDIASIKKCGFKTTTTVGASTLGASIIAFLVLRSYYTNKDYGYDNEGNGGIGAELISFAALFISGVTTLIGGIQWATVRDYDMTMGKWKFEVYSEAELSHFHKPVSKAKTKENNK